MIQRPWLIFYRIKNVIKGLSNLSYIVPSQTQSEQYHGPLSGGSISTTSETDSESGGGGSDGFSCFDLDEPIIDTLIYYKFDK